MGYQGNRGNLPEKKQEQVKNKTTDRSSNFDDVPSDNTEQIQQVAGDTGSSSDTGTRDTDTDTLGNP